MTASEKVNILLVDDQPGKLLSYEVILEELGQNLIKANSAREALEHLLKSDIAVVLIDVCMPDLDGFELTALIREHPRCRNTAIILVSAILMTDPDRIRGYGNGAVDYVSVPVVPEVLRAKVNVFVDLYRKSEQLEELNRDLEARVAERTADLEASNARLRESEMRFRLATEAMPGGVYDWDLVKGTVDRSSGLVTMLGCGAEESGSGVSWWVDRIHPEDRDARASVIDAALLSLDRTYGAEYRVRRDGGEWIWTWDRGRIVRDEDGRAVRVVGHITDVTAQREADELLREADRRKDEFLATLAHELRNPLAPIRNTVAAMRRKPLTESELEWCRDIIDRQVMHLTRLVDDLLDVGRITQGKIELQRDRVALSEILDAAVEACHPMLERGAYAFEIVAHPEPVFLRVDRIRITQCLVNLLSNAVKFTPRGGQIRLEVEKAFASDGSGRVLLKIRDSGIGIAPGDLPRVFDLFYQVDNSIGRSQAGLGIGLTLVRRLLELHGGTIEAYSAGADAGSEFVIGLPMLAEAGRDSSPAREAKTLSSPGRILIADDNQDAAESLALLLRRAGGEVRTAHDGGAALELAKRFQPEIVLLDLGMPTITGYDVAAGIRETSWGSGAILVAVTGWGQDEERRRTVAAGFDAHLVKPVDHTLLLSTLAKLRDRARPLTSRA